MYRMIGIFFLLFLSSCGIEVAQSISRLYAPNGVKVTATGGGDFTVTWYGLNPESGFSGYNIYYTDNDSDALNYRGLKIYSKTGGSSRDATLSVTLPFNTTKFFTHTFNKDNGTQKLPFTAGITYYFFVRAYNKTRNLESPPSLYYKSPPFIN